MLFQNTTETLEWFEKPSMLMSEHKHKKTGNKEAEVNQTNVDILRT